MLSGDRPLRTALLLPLLVLAAMGLRLIWVLICPADQKLLEKLPDQRGYLEMAGNLLGGHGLVWTDPRLGKDTYAVRMPLYPLFVAACGANILCVRIVQVLIDSSTVVAVYLLARRCLARQWGLAACALTALNPFLIFFCAMVLTETLYTSILVWAAVLLLAPVSQVWGGLLLAAGVLVRPSGIGLPLVLGLAATFAARRLHHSIRTRWPVPVGATMLLLTAAALLPWAIRNRAVLGRWIWTTTNSGFVAYDGFHPDASGASDQRFVSSLEWNWRLRQLSEVQRSEALGQAAWQWVRETVRQRPSRLVHLTLAKIARTWSPVPLSTEFSDARYRATGLAYGVPLYGLAILGLLAGSPALSVRFFLLTPAIYFTVVHALSVGSMRYRLPAEPMLSVLAAAGLATVAGLLTRRIRRPGAGGGEGSTWH